MSPTHESNKNEQFKNVLIFKYFLQMVVRVIIGSDTRQSGCRSWGSKSSYKSAAFQTEMNLRKLVQLLKTFETTAQHSSRIENIYDIYLIGL